MDSFVYFLTGCTVTLSTSLALYYRQKYNDTVNLNQRTVTTTTTQNNHNKIEEEFNTKLNEIEERLRKIEWSPILQTPETAIQSIQSEQKRIMQEIRKIQIQQENT